MRIELGEIRSLGGIGCGTRRDRLPVSPDARDQPVVLLALIGTAGEQVRGLRRFRAHEPRLKVRERLTQLLAAGDALDRSGEVDARAISETGADEQQHERSRESCNHFFSMEERGK